MRGTDTNPEAYNTRYYIGESEVSKETFDALDALRQQLAECERERVFQANAHKMAQDALLEQGQQLATVTKERDELVAALSSIRECVFAAMFEGLQDRLAEEENTDAGSLYDLVMRRLLPMDAYAQAALAKLGADKTGDES